MPTTKPPLPPTTAAAAPAPAPARQTRAARPAPLFDLREVSDRLPTPVKPVGMVARPVLERALKLRRLSRDYADLLDPRRPDADTLPPPTTGNDFATAALARYGIAVGVSPGDLERIPKTGPVVVVANHPFGGIEGLMLLSILARIRPDAKFMANFLLARIPELRDRLICVDPFGSDDATRANVRGLKDSLAWLRKGHLLGVFPAGEVAALRWGSKGKVADPTWSPHVAGLARRAGAAVVPVHIKGTNSALFQLAGLVHPLLRTALLPREMVNKRERLVRIRIGTAIPSARIESFQRDGKPDDERTIDYCRLRSEVLGMRRRLTATQRRKEAHLSTRRRKGQTPLMAQIIEPVDPAAVEAELNTLPADATLLDERDYRVLLARSDQMPHAMRELGRLREVTFRAVGEGSGQPLDVDRFDDGYDHLILWHKADRRIAGAYRLGRFNQILPAQGAEGLYTQTLFKLTPEFLRKIGPHATETGRSFVRVEYQRSFAPLLNLWRGLCLYCDRFDQRYLMGPVSISNSYCKLSKAMIVQRMTSPAHRSDLAEHVKPRSPFCMKRFGRKDVMRLPSMAEDLHDLSHVISDIEPDGKGFPILMRQYLGWNAKTLGVNVDPDFNACVDCLVVVDMPHGPDKNLKRYLGDADTVAAYRAKFDVSATP